MDGKTDNKDTWNYVESMTYADKIRSVVGWATILFLQVGVLGYFTFTA